MKVKWFRYIVLLGGLAVIGMTGMISPQLVLSDDRPDMVVAVQKLPPNLEPMADNSNVHARIIRNLGDRLLLIDYKDNFKIIPNLAESWKRIDDRTIEFKLRKGVKLHDGNELTSEDVAFSFGNDRLFHEERGLTTTKPFLGNIEVPKVIDDYTVRIRSKQPDPLLEKRVAIYKSEIVSRKAFEKVGDWQKWTLQTVASGPYKLVEFKTGDYIKLVAHDDYWGPKAPAKSITFKAVPEVAARIAGLKTGEFHIITEIPPDQLKSIEAAEDCAAVGGPIPNIRSVNFDTTNPILASNDLRKAMLMAVDRQLIVDSLYHARTNVPNGFQMKVFGDMYIEDYKSLPYDPDKAKELVKKSGYKGETITYRILPNYYTLEVATAQVLVDMWKAVGINVKIEMKENWNQILQNDDTRHLWNLSNTAYFFDPVGQIWRRLGPQCWVRHEDKFGAKEPMYVFPAEFDKQGQILATSSDLQQRRHAAQRMMEIVEHEYPAQLNLHALTMFYGKRESVVWEPDPSEDMDLTATSLSFK